MLHQTNKSSSSQPQQRQSSNWMSKLRRGLSATRQSLLKPFTQTSIDEAWFEEMEHALISADCGVQATTRMLNQLREQTKKQNIRSQSEFTACVEHIFAQAIQVLEQPFPLVDQIPQIIMVCGINGVGKTTSIGKLAHLFHSKGQQIILAAGDTFRAAARDQLEIWANRSQAQFISQQDGDPASVAYDAVKAAYARKADVLLIDTAGRLTTQKHLMEEIKKIKRTIAKAAPIEVFEPPPHQILLILDGSTGQNAIAQLQAFHEALNITGLIVTKLDGSARGGILAAIAEQCPVPVYFIGVGEALGDLQSFSALSYAQALMREDASMPDH